MDGKSGEEDGDQSLLIQSRVRYESPSSDANMAATLLDAMRRHSSRTLLVDVAAWRQWTGAQLLDTISRVATSLIRRVGVRPASVVLTMTDHSDIEVIMALGAIFAGASLFGTNPEDGHEEIKTLCGIVKPDVIVTQSRLHPTALALRKSIAGAQGIPIIWLDNPTVDGSSATTGTNGIQTNGNAEVKNMTDLNNNDDCYSIGQDQYAKAIADNQVYLYEQLASGPLDEQLVERVAKHQIKPATDILTYMLTSGSTGRPKIVPSTHEELMHGIYSMISACKYPIGSSEQRNGEISEKDSHKIPLLPLDADSVMAGDLPLDHGAGVNTMFLSLYLGSKFVIMPAYNEETFWQSVHKYRITSSISSTTFAYRLLSYLKSRIDSKTQSELDLSCFRYIATCGSKLAFEDLVGEIQRIYPQMNVVQAYGCTEIGFISIQHIVDSKAHLDSVGYLFPGLVAKIVDKDTGTIIPKEKSQGSRGELLLSAQSKFKGYRCQPEDDCDQIMADCHDDKMIFYKTGDQIHMDSEGRIFVHGRFKDTLFLMEDWKILPIELERVVDEHPLVEQSAVVGIPDEQLPGCHAPKAFVKLISPESKEFQRIELDSELRQKLLSCDRDFIARHVYEFVAERTAGPKHLKGGVRVVDEFPRNGLLNKIDRKALRLMD